MNTGSCATWMFATTLCATACAGAAVSGDDPSHEVSDTSASQPSVPPEQGALTASAPSPARAESALQDEDWGKPWRQLAAPSISMDGAVVAGAPGGWIAVSTRVQDSKAPPPPDSFAYFSTDGTHWHAIPTPGDSPLREASVAYGGGHYVIAGSRSAPVVLDSTDGQIWHEQSLDGLSFAGPVTYVGDRFLYVSASLWGSTDGEHWAALPHDYPFPLVTHIAYGNGVYLGAGTQTLLSSDGVEWRAAPLDCALPLDCDTDPRGNFYPPPVSGVFFAEGRFHLHGVEQGGSPWQLTSSDGELTSVDGESWQFVPGRVPDAYVAGRFTQFLGAQPLVWFPGDSTPQAIEVSHGPALPPIAYPEEPPADVDLSWSDDIDCTNARCVLIHSKLYLVP
jgi:hypothetical protein